MPGGSARGGAWSTGHEGTKGAIAPGQLADFSILDSDFFEVADDDIQTLRAELTAVGGEVVFAEEGFRRYDAGPLPPVTSTWSPVRVYGGYQRDAERRTRGRVADEA
ncbi:MAG: amidohydrolase family protein [Planctomycetota bacterium]